MAETVKNYLNNLTAKALDGFRKTVCFPKRAFLLKLIKIAQKITAIIILILPTFWLKNLRKCPCR